MLLQQEAREVSRTGVMETAKATIKATPKIFSFFADQTYANKPRAICRELVANAWDSHTMSGNRDPVEVWLPTLVDPVFKVRDFGLGMSHEFMMNDFMRYTDGSTKDQSNIAIGGFGIGSKSPFAYVDQYTIRSIFDGTLSVYSVFKDEDGIPSIALLDQRSTDDPNGVEVSFPVEPDDFENFRVAAFEALKYFDPLPTVRGGGQHRFEAQAYVSQGKTWGMRKEAGPLQVIMGGIMYPVDPAALSSKFTDETAKKMLTYGLDIRVPIGTCSVALSREALSYDDRTVQGLMQACMSVVSEVSASFKDMFDHLTFWDAKVGLYNEVYPEGERSYYNRAATRGQFLAGHALYKGVSFEMEHQFMLPGGFSAWDLEPKHRRRGFTGKCPNPKWEYYEQYALKITPGRYEHIIIDDLPRSPKSKTIARIKEFVDTDLKQEKQILVIRATDDTLKAKRILDILGNPTQVTLTSTLPMPVYAPGSNATVRPKVRMFTYNGATSGNYSWQQTPHDNLNPGRYGKTGVEEIEYAKQPSSGILFVMESFALTSDFLHKMRLGLVAWTELHFVNKSDGEKLDRANWQDFDDVFNERLKAKLKSVRNLGQMLAVDNAIQGDARTFLMIQKNRALPLAGNPLGELVKLYEKYVVPISADNRKFGPYVNVKLPDGVDPAALWDKFMNDYPRAHRLLDLLRWDVEPNDQAFFVELLK